MLGVCGNGVDVGGCCLFSGQGEGTLQVEVFAQGVLQDRRVQLSPFTKKKGESDLLRTRQGEESSFGYCSTQAPRQKQQKVPKRNRVAGISVSRPHHPQLSALSPQPSATSPPGQEASIIQSELQIWVPPPLTPTHLQGSPALFSARDTYGRVVPEQISPHPQKSCQHFDHLALRHQLICTRA